MKKLMVAACAALCATVGFSDVESANTVGYMQVPVNKQEIKVLAVDFGDVAESKAVPLNQAFTYTNQVGSTSLGDAADQIWTYKSGAWSKYFWYEKLSTKEWRYMTGTSTSAKMPDSITVAPGEAFFFQRSNASKSSGTTLTLSGGVVPLKTKVETPVAKQQIVVLSNPWPISFKVNEFNNHYTNAVGSTSLGDAADQFWTYKNGAWTKYFWYEKLSTKEWRYMTGTSTSAKVTDSVTIEPGEAFFFQRSNATKSSDTTITFKGPEFAE